MIYGYLRTSRAAVDVLAGRHPETQVQALADAGVEPASIVSDVGISGSVPAGDRPGWSGLDARLLRSDTVTVAALDRTSRNRVDLVAVVESLHRLGVGIASLALAGGGLHSVRARSGTSAWPALRHPYPAFFGGFGPGIKTPQRARFHPIERVCGRWTRRSRTS